MILQNLQSKDENQQFSAALEMCQVSPYFPVAAADDDDDNDPSVLSNNTIVKTWLKFR